MTKTQLDRLLSILDRAVKVAERWADREYPCVNEEAETSFGKVGEALPEPDSREGYLALETEGRFESQFRKTAT
jgi:hypothetical protein